MHLPLSAGNLPLNARNSHRHPPHGRLPIAVNRASHRAMAFVRLWLREFHQRPDRRQRPTPAAFFCRIAEMLSPAFFRGHLQNFGELHRNAVVQRGCHLRDGKISKYVPSSWQCSGHHFTLPLNDRDASGPHCIPSLQQGEIRLPIHPSYTTGRKSVSYNQ